MAPQAGAPRRRLAPGSYEPADLWMSQPRARALFFAAVRRVVPRVYDDLAGEPFELFRSCGFSNAAELWSLPESAAPALWAGLRRWGKRWNLADGWVLETVLTFLDDWLAFPEHHATRTHPEVPSSEGDWTPFWRSMLEPDPLPPDDRRVSFDAEWDPILTTRAEAERELRGAFEDYLRRRLDEIETLAESRGLVPTAEKRRPEHFEWLVYYQVELWSQGEIAEQYGVDRTTVRDALKHAADLLGLTLRPRGRPGRPRGSTRS